MTRPWWRAQGVSAGSAARDNATGWAIRGTDAGNATRADTMILVSGAAALILCAAAAFTPGPGAAGWLSSPAQYSAALKRGLVETASGKRFEVEVVTDPGGRETGLKKRSSVPPGTGMLFVFPKPGRHRFWMFECLTSLDILWLDADRRVVHIEERLPVCPGPAQRCPDYGPDSETLYVLELGPGVAAASKLHAGDRLTILFAEPPNPT